MKPPETYVGGIRMRTHMSGDRRGHGENAARPWHQHRLAERKDKDCDRQPRQCANVQHTNEGRHDGMPRELAPMPIMLAESP